MIGCSSEKVYSAMCGRYVQIPKKFSYIMKIVECNIPMTILYVFHENLKSI